MTLRAAKASKKSERELRKFGWTLGIVFIGLGLLFLWGGRPTAPYMLGAGIILVCTAFLFPRGLAPIENVWMVAGIAIGSVMTNLILIVIFYAVITPLGFFLKLFGKRFLDREFRAPRSSYWHHRARASHRNNLEKQF